MLKSGEEDIVNLSQNKNKESSMKKGESCTSSVAHLDKKLNYVESPSTSKADDDLEYDDEIYNDGL